MLDRVPVDREVLFVLGASSLAIFLVSLALVPLLVIRMRPDYFLHPEPEAGSFRGRHPAIRLAGRVVKNLVGGLLLIAGILMLVLPGQGILTMLIGLTLVQFPGKRRLELGLVRLRGVSAAIAWTRRKAGRPPLELPAPAESRAATSDDDSCPPASPPAAAS